MSAVGVSAVDRRALAAGVALPQALAFGALTALVTTLGHLAVGGTSALGVLGAVPVWAAAVGVRQLLGRCRCSLPALVTVCLALQLGSHLLLLRAMAPEGPTLVPACGGMLPSVLPTESSSMLLSGPAMIGIHVGIALVTAWWLRRGERLVQALGTWVRSCCRVPALQAPLVPTRARVAVPGAVRRLHARLLVAAPGCRAPPVTA